MLTYRRNQQSQETPNAAQGTPRRLRATACSVALEVVTSRAPARQTPYGVPAASPTDRARDSRDGAERLRRNVRGSYGRCAGRLPKAVLRCTPTAGISHLEDVYAKCRRR